MAMNSVVAVYDNLSDAQKVKDELLDRGFSENRVHLTSPGASATRTRTTEDDLSGGGMAGFFRTLFGMEDERDYTASYSEAVRRGSAVVTVTAANDDELDRAREVMEEYGPVDIDERAEQWRSAGWSGYDPNATPYSEADIERERAGLQGKQRIPVVEEELKVGKRQVGRGGVRVFSRIEEEPVEQDLRLREERAKVERRSVDRPATEADLAAFKEGSVEVRETAEEPVVEKTARVVEEVLVGKEASERTEKVRDTVRRTKVDVEELSGQTTSDFDRYEADFRNHAQTSYAGRNYEDYAPAYRYGHGLASDPRYSGRDWNAIEADARRDWESRSSGSTWDQIKGAVRYGWEKVRGRR
jgi:uncharacterized protein (TIGR02271 family)